MVKAIVVNGFPGSGKTTFESYCKEHIAKNMPSTNCVIKSSVEYVKRVAKTLGWDGEKDDKGRKLLSALKFMLTEYNDSPFQTIVSFVNKCKESNLDFVVFVDIRELDEIDRAKRELNATTVFVNRLSDAPTNGCNSDTYVTDYQYDYVIDNTGSEESLKEAADTFLHDLFNGGNN